jgi:hypothetical protein
MATPVFHPCRFNFDDQDIRRIGSVTSGGGYWVAEFTNGQTFERDDTLAWRAITAGMDNGAAAVIVEFCDRLHTPNGGEMGVAGSTQQFGDRRSFTGPGVVATTIAPANLRGTSLGIDIDSERELVGGESFTIVHPTWGERAYQVVSVSGSTIRFRPPLREAVTTGTALDFDNPRCRMRMASPASNALNIGRYGSCSISFVEDMRKP